MVTGAAATAVASHATVAAADNQAIGVAATVVGSHAIGATTADAGVTIATVQAATSSAAGGIARQTKSLRGLVTKKPNVRRKMDARRGRGPKGYQRSDERIREDVSDRLTDDYYLDASDVEVQVSGAEVILTGTVNSRNEKRRAEDLAESAKGVKNVENRIRVKQGDRSAYGQLESTGTTGTSTSSAAAAQPEPAVSVPQEAVWVPAAVTVSAVARASATVRALAAAGIPASWALAVAWAPATLASAAASLPEAA